MTHLNDSPTPCCYPNGSLAFPEEKSDLFLLYNYNKSANIQLELTYLYSMEHVFVFFSAQLPNSIWANAFCNLNSNESYWRQARLLKCASNWMSVKSKFLRMAERKMVLPFESVIQRTVNCYNLRRQGVVLRDNEHYALNWGRLSRKQNCSLMHFLEVSKTIYSIIQQLKFCMVWL